jgi:hypothetical protein
MRVENLLLRQKPKISPDEWSIESIAAYLECDFIEEFAGIVYQLEPEPRLVEDQWEPAFFRNWAANYQ